MVKDVVVDLMVFVFLEHTLCDFVMVFVNWADAMHWKTHKKRKYHMITRLRLVSSAAAMVVADT